MQECRNCELQDYTDASKVKTTKTTRGVKLCQQSTILVVDWQVDQTENKLQKKIAEACRCTPLLTCVVDYFVVGVEVSK